MSEMIEKAANDIEIGVMFYDFETKSYLDRLIRSPLNDFTMWWLSNRDFLPPHNEALDFNGNLHGVVLFRRDNFQVQLISVKPNSFILPHRHPNVDTYEIYFSGEHVLTMNGEAHYTMEDVVNKKKTFMGFDLPIGFGIATRIKPTDWHSVNFGPKGGSFLSIQEWLNGEEPTSVGHDWIDEGYRECDKCVPYSTV